MTQNRFIVELTPEQEVLFLGCQEKWENFSLMEGKISRKKSTEAIKLSYEVLDRPEPAVIFCDSPCKALEELNKLESPSIVPLMDIGWQLRRTLPGSKQSQSKRKLQKAFVKRPLWSQLKPQLENQLGEKIVQAIQPDRWLNYVGWFDFCISVLNYCHDQKKWRAFQLLVEHCGLTFPFEKICIVCDRPNRLMLDGEQRLHAVGEAAVIYPDGFSLYFYHGTGLPEKYGTVLPSKWKSQWLLEENSFELRQVLIQEIGYNRIIEELPLVEIDVWKNNILFRVDNAYGELFYLLKLAHPDAISPSIVQVPPDIKTAFEAFCWLELVAKSGLNSKHLG